MRIADVLIAPSKNIKSSHEQVRAQIFSSLVILHTMTLILVVIAGLKGWLGPLETTKQWVPVVASLVGINFILYVVSRTKHYRIACSLLILISNLSITYVILNDFSLHTLSATVWYGIGVIICSLVLSTPATIFWAIAAFISYGILASHIPQEYMSYLTNNFYYFMTEISLILVNMILRERAEAQLSVEKSKVLHAAKLTSLGEMAGGVAHEINTPLAIIGLKTEQIEEYLSEVNSVHTERMKKSVDVIRKTSERIAKIVNGLRFFARDSTHMPSEPTVLYTIVENTLGLCHERFSKHGITIEVSGTPNYKNIIVSCRAVEISQVLLNLLNNSFDAIQHNDELWVRIEILDNASTIAINVIDSGKGISEDRQPKLMQPFYTTKAPGTGLGLGLSISRGIIESHNGHLTYDPSSKNTKFAIELPRNTEHFSFSHSTVTTRRAS